MNRQLTLDLPLRESRGREDFFVSPANALALAALDDWQGWPAGKAVLAGPPGSGKTHLAHIWAAATGARIVAASALAQADLPSLARTAVATEDAEHIGGRPEAENALFHLHNMMAAAGLPLLITAAGPPRDWGLRLPDLASRMQAATLIRLDPPDDPLLHAVLAKQFADRQVAIPAGLIEWLVPRMTRSFAAARDLVTALDARSLEEGTPITRQMAADWLEGDSLFPDLD
ncbi:MAG: chromosomal replication initiator DnaA [Rhodobacterales bacterium]|nr:chromosomal replication initiator DnaA [Rhodobacterales bacterium]MDX5500356.1 chromosomal replication initiator DnaA [Rhodobacterales bacterium]